MKRTESVLVGLVCAVMALLFAYLCVYGSIFTSTIAEKHYTVETIVQVQDQPLFSLLGLLVACGILWLFSKVEGKIPLRAMVIFSLVWAALLGTLWVLAVRTEPRADAAEIVDAARQAMSRNYTELKRKDGYMNRHPYQLGFMAFSQLLQTIFGPKNYLALQLVNVAFLTLAYGGTLRLLWLMTKKARTVRYGALLLLLCLQPILYVTFLYGNMASIACTLWAMCCLCRLARDGGVWRLIPAGLLCGLSVMMKPNGWIPVIAMLIVTGLWFLSEKKWKLLPLLLLLAAGPLISTQTVKSSYSTASGADLSKGVPMTAYLAMGLQESNRAPGWYNEYVEQVYENANYDPEKTSERAKKNIRARLEEFAKDPAYTFQFFYEKMVSQWNETTFEAVWISRTCPYDEENRSYFGDVALNGHLRPVLEKWMDGYTLALYALFSLTMGAFARKLLRRPKEGEEPLPRPLGLGLSLCAVTVTGAFLYHMIFEAKSQYLFIYLFLMIPAAAWGLSCFFARPRFTRKARS